MAVALMRRALVALSGMRFSLLQAWLAALPVAASAVPACRQARLSYGLCIHTYVKVWTKMNTWLAGQEQLPASQTLQWHCSQHCLHK